MQFKLYNFILSTNVIIPIKLEDVKILLILLIIERRMTGLEPANGGSTNHCRNHLATLACNNLILY